MVTLDVLLGGDGAVAVADLGGAGGDANLLQRAGLMAEVDVAADAVMQPDACGLLGAFAVEAVGGFESGVVFLALSEAVPVAALQCLDQRLRADVVLWEAQWDVVLALAAHRTARRESAGRFGRRRVDLDLGGRAIAAGRLRGRG